MKNIVFGALLLGATSLATGCIFVSGDDDGGDGDGDTGDILLSWTTDPGCPVGGETAQLTAAPTNGGQAFVNLFNCTDGAGRIDDLPTGTYDVFINITSDDEAVLFAQSFSERDVIVSRNADTIVDEFTILTADAFFGFDWEISDNGTLVSDCSDLPALTSAQLDCNVPANACAAGFTCDGPSGVCFGPADGVGIIATFVTDSEIIPEDDFACTPTGSGQAGPFPLGDYENVIFSIIDSTGAAMVDTAPIATADLLIGNGVEDLGTAVFDVTVP